jgi:seryl-tRNA synthetase
LLLNRYAEEAEQIENIDELYTKFRNLKLYEIEYDKHEELKKELAFWNNPNSHRKSQKELMLEGELHRVLEISQAYKKQQPHQEYY